MKKIFTAALLAGFLVQPVCSENKKVINRELLYGAAGVAGGIGIARYGTNRTIKIHVPVNETNQQISIALDTMKLKNFFDDFRAKGKEKVRVSAYMGYSGRAVSLGDGFPPEVIADTSRYSKSERLPGTINLRKTNSFKAAEHVRHWMSKETGWFKNISPMKQRFAKLYLQAFNPKYVIAKRVAFWTGTATVLAGGIALVVGLSKI